jgi:hypothetical protein
MEILGVHLGAAGDFAEPSVHNPKGYWEHQSIQKINEEILSRLGYDYARAGADWTGPPQFPDGWERDPQLADLRERAEDLVNREFAEHGVSGWKDPRTCFTLPFWRSMLPRMQYVILIRNPVDVARSIERFLDCSFERGLYMWSLFLSFAFQHTTGQHRLLVNVEAWTDDWKGELTRLARFLGNPDLADDTGVQNAIQELVDKSLWHHRTSSRALSTVQELYERVSGYSGIQEQESWNGSQDTIDLLASEALHSDAEKSQRDKIQWEKQLALASDELAELVPPGSNLVLVDDNQFGSEIIQERNVIPFLERNGQYWGSPPDGTTAVSEFERMRENGADYMAFIWPARWWLHYFPELNDRLRSGFRCILQNERLVVFDLQS